MKTKMKNLFKYFFLICFITTFTNVEGQTVYHELRTLKGNFTDFEVDALDNIYTIFGATVTKNSSPENSVFTYNNVKKYGKPTSVNVFNPFKVLLFYKTYQTIVLLDKYMSSLGSINLRKSGLYKVNVIASSYDNKIWAFDEQDYKLKKLNDDGIVLSESTDIRLILDDTPRFSSMFDASGKVILYDVNRGIYFFDYYGAFLDSIEIKDLKSTGVSGNVFYGIYENEIFTVNIKSGIIHKMPIPEILKGSLFFKMNNDKIYSLSAEGIKIIEWN